MTQSGDLTESALPGFTSEEVMRKARVENFSVASRFIPRHYRERLLAMYGFARFVDDIGDLSTGDRIAQLDWAQAETIRAFDGGGTHSVFVRAAKSATELKMGIEPFLDLIQANRQDQEVKRYRTYADLEQYCSLSANPVGQMVLSIFGAYSGETSARSDEACTALQIIEHLQDVSEDAEQGRIYLPQEDLERFNVEEAELTRASASPGLRLLIRFEVQRAHSLLESSRPLVRLLGGWARIAVTGFIGGGLAQIDAIIAADFDVLSYPVKARRSSVLKRTLGVYVGALRDSGSKSRSSPEVRR
ncbi:MAG TPA: squalene synthase HpnC [Acidimicrobiales bacterium]|nr:squalene synthase HpnC [Acidimicrobiales bacterium]